MSRRAIHDSGRRLDEALERLPRRAASPGFTRRVLATLEDRSGGTADGRGERFVLGPARLATGIAVLALLPLILVLRSTGPGQPEPESPSPTTRAAELRVEYRTIEAELAALRQSLEADSSTLYLATDGGVDLVVDVAELASLARSGTRRSGFTFANEEYADEPPR